MDPMLGNFEVWFNEWTILNGDFVNGYLVKVRSFYFFLNRMQSRPAHYQLSVINYFSYPFFSYPLSAKYPKCLYQAVLVSFFNTSFSTCISFKIAMQASFNGKSSNFAIWKTTSESIPL